MPLSMLPLPLPLFSNASANAPAPPFAGAITPTPVNVRLPLPLPGTASEWVSLSRLMASRPTEPLPDRGDSGGGNGFDALRAPLPLPPAAAVARVPPPILTTPAATEAAGLLSPVLSPIAQHVAQPLEADPPGVQLTLSFLPQSLASVLLQRVHW